MSKKILIIDDSPISRKIVKQCIGSSFDCEFHEAGDGAAAVAKYQEVRPHVTFLDLTMPVMDGKRALAEIKSLDENAVIVVTTADVQVQTLKQVMALGAMTVIKKPPTKETVQEALRKALGEHGAAE